MLKEAKSFALFLAGQFSHLAVSYGPPIGAFYVMDQNDLLEPYILAAILPAVIWVFVAWWLTRSWSDWGSVEDEEVDTDGSTESLLKGRFNPERAAAITAAARPRPRTRVSPRLILIVSLLMLTSVTVTAAYYELNDRYEHRYERCILRNMPGTPAPAVRLVHDACRELSR